MRAFPAATVAAGWYQIGWSHDFADEPMPLHYFERDLVAYRGASGDLVVLDAYCAHLGAHLGHGGVVEGECIRCPFHGWAYDANGANVEIPYGRGEPMANVRLRRWPTAEIDGLALVYFSVDPARKPDPLPEAFNRCETEVWPISESTTNRWPIQPMTPIVVAENSIDAAHFKYVHRSNDAATVGRCEAGEGVFSGEIHIRFGGHKQITWATPEGPVDGRIFTEQWGLGIGRAQLVGFDDITYVLGVTPVSPYESELRSTTWIPKTRSDGSPIDEAGRDRWVRQQNSQVDADLRIWNHQNYIQKPPLERTEVSAMRAFRKWSKQFYDDPLAPNDRKAGAHDG